MFRLPVHMVFRREGNQMVMSRIWGGIILISIVFAWLTGNGAPLSAAVMEGAQAGITLAISMAGSICLWSGVGNLIEKVGMTDLLSRLLKPFLFRLFPSSKKDPALSRDLSANICANFLGLGNAATPMGLSAAKRMATGKTASDELCRLIVLNSASIQLIPANVAALRTSLGCHTPFDILPAVWLTSLCSAGLGLFAAWILGKLWRHG